jgi:hypothetical protein
VVFGDADEFQWRDHAEHRVVPAAQGFERKHLPRQQVQLGLIDQMQTLVGQGLAEAAHQLGFAFRGPGVGEGGVGSHGGAMGQSIPRLPRAFARGLRLSPAAVPNLVDKSMNKPAKPDAHWPAPRC